MDNAASQDTMESRQLNVTDALTYLDAVKNQFQDKPDVYNRFLDIMKEFKNEEIDTPGVIARVSTLFHGIPFLIKGFNTFLPSGYRIDLASDPNLITVTTPSGTTTQATTTQAPPPMLPPIPFAAQHYMPPHPPVHNPFDLVGYPSPGNFTIPTSVAASFLGGLSSGSAGVASGHHRQQQPDSSPIVTHAGGIVTQAMKPPGDVNHAIQYLNKIKARYADDANTYKKFLNILQTYQKEQRDLQDSQVYVQVQHLFKDSPDLLQEFQDFLPDVVGHSVLGSWGGASESGSKNAINGPGGAKSAQTKKRRRPAAEKDPPQPTTSSTSSIIAAKQLANGAAAASASTSGSVANSRNKKTKHHHDRAKVEPHEIGYDAFGASSAISPAPTSLLPQQQLVMLSTSGAPTLPTSSILPAPPDAFFFTRVKKALEGQPQAYDDLLKLLDLYTKEIVPARVLMARVMEMLGDTHAELFLQFKALLGTEAGTDPEKGPPGSIRTGPPDSLSLVQPTDDGQGPSYRRLPDSEIYLACSGRDELCRSVLNDHWFSHPTWASEESGFNSHKKNSFEEALHKSEEERHEYHVTLEALARTLAHFEPLAARLDMMETAEERAAFRLGPDLGAGADGGVKIFERILRKIYGREGGNEVVQALRESPSVAVPVVLARLRQKDEEWRAAHREWSRTWREVDAKNFYKSLDSQGIGFKANDKKATTSKSFVMEIENIKATQEKERHEKARHRLKKRGAGSGRRGGSVGLMGSTGWQLEYAFEDTHVMQDSLKMIYSFLDHSAAQYSSEERRAVERFLRAFVPILCMYPVHEFDAACGSLEEVAAVVSSMVDDGSGEAIVNGIDHPDARRPSPINMNGNLHSLHPHDDEDGDGDDDDDEEPVTFKPKTEDAWIRELTSPAPDGDPTTSQSPLTAGPSSVRRPFFANTTFYTLLRLLQLLYSRLLMCKERGAALAAEGHASLRSNPVAVDLGLEEAVNAQSVLAQSIEMMGAHAIAASTSIVRPSSRSPVPPGNITTTVNGTGVADGAGDTPAPPSIEPPNKPLGEGEQQQQQGNGSEHEPSRTLPDPDGESVVIEEEEMPGRANVVYMYLLEKCEKVFSNEMDQTAFEEHMRWFFGTKAYHVFTLDKLILSIVKQVQTILAEHKCQQLWSLLQAVRGAESMTVQDKIRYRRQAERLVGSDEHLYRVDWDPEQKMMRMQLLEADDPSVDEDGGEEGRWREYAATFVLDYATEWLPRGRRSPEHCGVYLKRNLPSASLLASLSSLSFGGAQQSRQFQQSQQAAAAAAATIGGASRCGLRVRISLGTYKLFYEAGSEDMLLGRERTTPWPADWQERARAAVGEKRRRIGTVLFRGTA